MIKKILKRKPLISIVVVAYNMGRELPRTLHSLTREYQCGIENLDYEVLVIDNGSSERNNENFNIKSYGSNFHYHYIENASPSPVEALNFGASIAKGKILCFMIDGARICSPGILRSAWAMFTSKAYQLPTVSVIGFHLGPELQNESTAKGYNQQEEDQLLQSIDWKHNGYRLFEISVFAGSNRDGWFGGSAESNAIFIHKSEFEKIGRFEPRFDTPGGGFCNLDFYYRAVMRPNTENIVLLGEGTFHQVHGGVATNVQRHEKQKRLEAWRQQYKNIRGVEFTNPDKQPIYHGKIAAPVLPAIKRSILIVA